MAQKRKFVPRDHSVPREHPDGGTFYIKPLDSSKEMEFAELVREEEYLLGPEGEIVYNSTTGMPIQKRNEAAAGAALIDYACSFVTKVDDVENFETGEPIESTPEVIRALVGEVFDREVEVDGPEAGTKIKKAVPQLNALWVIEEAKNLANARKLAAVKNS